MQKLWQWLGFSSWAIWFKLIVGLLFIIVLPAIFGLAIADVQADRIARANLESYLTTEGQQRQRTITQRFEQALADMSTFLENQTFNGQLRGSLALGQELRFPPPALFAFMNDQMVGSGLYEYVVALDNDGLVVISTNIVGSEGDPVFPRGTDLSETGGYIAAVNAVERGESQSVSIGTVSGVVASYVSDIVYNTDGTVAGYVVGVIDNESAILDQLIDDPPHLGAYSYLATLNGDLLAPEARHDNAALSVRNSPIQLAIGGQSGVRSYTLNSDPYIGHYAPIENTPFAIVTEAPVGALFAGRITNSRLTPVFVLMFVIGTIAIFVGSRSLILPIKALKDGMQAVRAGSFDTEIGYTERQDEIGEMIQAFVEMREEVRLTFYDLNQRITERTRDLEATQDVSRFAAVQRDPQQLMDDVVSLIVDKFANIYHAQIFLINTERTDAILRASTGAPGQQLLARGHRLGVGSQSVIGRVTGAGEIVVARDIATSDVHRRNEFLPETNAELAIPLRFGKTIIGALDVQSKESNTFTEDQINVLQIMASQIAIAIENARLYQESVERLNLIDENNRAQTRKAWGDYMKARREEQLASEAGRKTDYRGDTLRERAIQTGEIAVGDETPHHTVPIAMPISLRGEVLGAVEWEIPANEYNEDKILLAQALVNRLAVSLDNARLFQESQRAINRERLVNEIAAELAVQTDIDQILQTAVREVGHALRAPEVSIKLQTNGNGQHEA